MTAGTAGLSVVRRDGEWAGQEAAVPLVGVSVQADLVGRGVRVEVTQTFENREAGPVEAVYRFPLPEGAALTGFRARVGERVFSGEVDERDRAFDRYDRALEQGHGAYLLDEERPNVFTLSVGNLNPGARAALTLTYVETLEAAGPEVRFTLPTTISPRYLPADAPDEDGVPAADRLHPTYADRVPYGLTLAVRVHGREGLAAVESPSHPVTCRLGADPVVVELASPSTRMDRDFVLTVRHAAAAPRRAWAAAGGQDGHGESFLQVDLALPAEPGDGPPGEVAFLLDCSGSMQGSSIDQARRALGIFLRGLPAGAPFNVYRFGSGFERLWPAARSATPEAAGQALAYLAKADADLGGTELLAPLQELCSQPLAGPGPRSVVLLTDGQVGNEAQVFDLVRAAAGRVRVFAVGIGHGPNDHLVRGLARASGGAAALIAPGERIEPRVLALFGKVMSPGVSGLRLQGVAGLDQAPADLVAFPGETVTLYGRWAGSAPPASVTVAGRVGGEARTWEVAVAAAEASPIRELWARAAIRDREEGGGAGGSRQEGRKARGARAALVELSKRYGVVCRETSFVVVEEREEADRTTGQAVLRKVPVPVTRGWHGRDEDVANSCSGVASFSTPLEVREEAAIAPRFFRRKERGVLGWAAFARPAPAPPPQHPDPDELLYDLLGAQQPSGGFELDDALARRLGASANGLRRAAASLGHPAPRAAYALISTALALAALEARFPAERATWAPLVQKSRDWLAAQEAKGRLAVDGHPLAAWAAARAQLGRATRGKRRR